MLLGCWTVKVIQIAAAWIYALHGTAHMIYVTTVTFALFRTHLRRICDCSSINDIGFILVSVPAMATFEVGPQYLRVVVALAVLATITVLLRLLSRWMTKRALGSDDCWILVGLVFTYGLVVNS